VDGGYFENDGLATAREVIDGIKRLDPELKPVLVRVTNEPSKMPGRLPRFHRPAAAPVLPERASGGLLLAYTSPLWSLYNTRQGHGAEAANEALKIVDDAHPPPEFIEIGVYDTLPGPPNGGGKAVSMADVSMSWWLSQPVQAFLDSQLRHRLNSRAVCDLMRVLLRPDAPADALAACQPDAPASGRPS
jgi:hypothetical protein